MLQKWHAIERFWCSPGQALSSGSFAILRTSLRRPEQRERGGRTSRSQAPTTGGPFQRYCEARAVDLRPLATSGLVTRISKYDTNYANHPQSPHCPPRAGQPIRESELNARFWHFSDVSEKADDVGSYGAKQTLRLRAPTSGFDPQPTTDVESDVSSRQQQFDTRETFPSSPALTVPKILLVLS
jgi:hypothetical protein